MIKLIFKLIFYSLMQFESTKNFVLTIIDLKNGAAQVS